LVLDTCRPLSVAAVDPSDAQINYARAAAMSDRVNFRVADAMNLPFTNGSFHVVVAALAINFIPAPDKGLREMARVARPGGILGAYVWDFAGTHSPAWPLLRALMAIGAEPPQVQGTSVSTLDALQSMFTNAGILDVKTTAIDVSTTYRDFEEYWSAATPSYLPAVQVMQKLPEPDRRRMREAVRGLLSTDAQARISYVARAHAVKGRMSERACSA
jgi:SAM-dependent methyltransferase